MKSRRTLTTIPFGEWLPDQPALGNQGLITAQNVIPVTAHSYGPMATMVAQSDAMASAATGFAWMEDISGQYYDFAGDGSALYMKPDTDSAWVDVSQSAVSYSPTAITLGWSFGAFGDVLIATNGTDAPQYFQLGTSTAFADLSADAPKALYTATIRDFLFLANLPDDSPQRVQWSAIGNPSNWPTPGTDGAIQVQSDYQDLQQTDLGVITGIVGGSFASDDGAIWCERGIYRVGYAGSPAFFEFAPVPGAPGTFAPRSIVRVPANTGQDGLGFYLGTDGFCVYNGSSATPIAAQKFNQTFFDDIDSTRLAYVLGAADPTRHLVFWAYHSAAAGTNFDRLLIYNWDVGHAALCDMTDTPLEWIMYRPIGYTGYGIAAFNNLHELATFTGDAMAPTLVTGDRQIFPGRRCKIQSVRPICDGDTSISIAVAARNLPTDAVSYQTAVDVNALGECPQRVNGRYARFKFTRPAAATFTQAQAIEVSAAPEGMRR